MKRVQSFIFIMLSIFILPVFVWAADNSNENTSETAKDEAVDESSRMIRHGRPVIGYQPLTVAGQEIDAAYIEETLGERYGAVVLLHDQGAKFESPGVITPLRHALPDHGWSTLTLAFDYPVESNILLSAPLNGDVAEAKLKNDEKTGSEDKNVEEKASEPNSLPPISNQQRIEAALAFLQAKGVKRIVFLGHGAGGDLAITLLDKITTPVSALILVGATALPSDNIFNKFNFPIFDIYGGNDLDNVPAAVKHRTMLMRRMNNTRYEVRRVVGADHVFLGLDATLTATVNGWLRTKFVEQNDN